MDKIKRTSELKVERVLTSRKIKLNQLLQNWWIQKQQNINKQNKDEKTKPSYPRRVRRFLHYFMTQTTIQNLTTIRKASYLKLNDLSHILGIDASNLSRFEDGKPYPKALVGYHVLFNLSIQNNIRQVFKQGYKELVHRSFQLLENLQQKSQTIKNNLRIEGVHKIIERLVALDEAYGK
jgi:DNA-binding Xre family transcriptional regulator